MLDDHRLFAPIVRSSALLVELVLHLDALLVSFVVRHHTHLLLHDKDAFTADFDSFPLICSILLNHCECLLQSNILFPLGRDVGFELLVILVYFWLTIVLYIFDFLNEILHEDVDLSSQCLSFLLEAR